jgi:hypothetical protein
LDCGTKKATKLLRRAKEADEQKEERLLGTPCPCKVPNLFLVIIHMP